MASTGAFTGRVGHKAGGFISKKFFHPSNFKNQEKLWQAVEAKKEQEKRQEEFMKKREEERRIEQLKNEMYGSSTSSDFKQALAANRPGLITHKSHGDALSTSEQRQAALETRKRLEMVRQEGVSEPKSRIAVCSRYPEDVLERGHSSVWGSYFDLKEQTWGYACCKCTQREVDCPVSLKRPKQ